MAISFLVGSWIVNVSLDIEFLLFGISGFVSLFRR